MFACCNHCYQKYLDRDGKIDWDAFLKIEPTYNLAVENDTVCMCHCHQIDLTVLH